MLEVHGRRNRDHDDRMHGRAHRCCGGLAGCATTRRSPKKFMDFLVRRNRRYLSDLSDHHFHSTEQRLARTCCAAATRRRSRGGERHAISQEMLAEMIGTTRPRVNFFMNKFRRLGMIEYRRTRSCRAPFRACTNSLVDSAAEHDSTAHDLTCEIRCRPLCLPLPGAAATTAPLRSRRCKTGKWPTSPTNPTS